MRGTRDAESADHFIRITDGDVHRVESSEVLLYIESVSSFSNNR